MLNNFANLFDRVTSIFACTKFFNYYKDGSFFCLNRMELNKKYPMIFGNQKYLVFKTITNHLVFEEVQN